MLGSYRLLFTGANHCSEFCLPKCPMPKATFMYLSMQSWRAWLGRVWGGDLTFFQKFAVKFLACRQIIPVKYPKISPPQASHLTGVKYPKARPKKSATNISQNVTDYNLYLLNYVAASPKIRLKSAAAPIIIINAKAFVTLKFIHRILIIQK